MYSRLILVFPLFNVWQTPLVFPFFSLESLCKKQCRPVQSHLSGRKIRLLLHQKWCIRLQAHLSPHQHIKCIKHIIWCFIKATADLTALHFIVHFTPPLLSYASPRVKFHSFPSCDALKTDLEGLQACHSKSPRTTYPYFSPSQQNMICQNRVSGGCWMVGNGNFWFLNVHFK